MIWGNVGTHTDGSGHIGSILVPQEYWCFANCAIVNIVIKDPCDGAGIMMGGGGVRKRFLWPFKAGCVIIDVKDCPQKCEDQRNRYECKTPWWIRSGDYDIYVVGTTSPAPPVEIPLIRDLPGFRPWGYR